MRPEENILFSGIDDYDCRRMIDCFKAETKKYKAGGIIAEYSNLNNKVGVILSGRAVVVKYDYNGNRTIIEVLEEQSIFGEFLIFTGIARNGVEVISETECEVMYIKYSEITKRCENACRCHSQVVENLLTLMSRKALYLSERIEVLSQRTIGEKLISCLQIIEDKTPKGKTPQIPFSTTALSDYLCVNRSALQREMAKLKEKGVLKIDKRKFRLVKDFEE
ncbi:MAG: Crp/Fnr family transcriptional regulator [Ruminococcus sp.]|nr:Crp/Fnr family transcriptional regulator [Ruminococcus sp.]